MFHWNHYIEKSKGNGDLCIRGSLVSIAQGTHRLPLTVSKLPLRGGEKKSPEPKPRGFWKNQEKLD